MGATMRENQKCIFVTGAASGIGRATALSFSENGWFVGLFDIDEDGLRAVARDIGEADCVSRKLDVTDARQWQVAVQQFNEATGGRMDVLFNNAGIVHVGRLEEIPLELNRRIIEVNLIGVINGIQTCFPLLKDTQNACIVNTSSIAGELGGPTFAAYAASKFGVRGLTDSLDLEFEAHDIRVCDIMPWFIDTPLLRNSQPHGASTNATLKDCVVGAGMAVNQIDDVVAAVWAAIDGKKTHNLVGLSAKILGPLNQHFPRISKVGKRQLLRKLALQLGLAGY